MRLGWNMPKDIPYFNFNCGSKSRLGSSACFSHFITVPVLEQIVKNDIAAKAKLEAIYIPTVHCAVLHIHFYYQSICKKKIWGKGLYEHLCNIGLKVATIY